MMLGTVTAGSPLPSLQLIRAEVLKLVTRRGLMVAACVLAVGTTIATYAILELLHLGNAAKHGPAGGTHNFSQAMWLITQLGSIAAILIGGTAGASDGSGRPALAVASTITLSPFPYAGRRRQAGR